MRDEREMTPSYTGGIDLIYVATVSFSRTIFEALYWGVRNMATAPVDITSFQ